MMRTSIAGFCMLAASALVASACSRGDQEGPAPATAATAGKHAAAVKSTTPVKADRVAYFAGGCFWGVEHFLQQLDGVASVESGYMGGELESPSYEQVTAKKSGHLETVRVRFDSKRVSYEQITRRFFEIHDPTQADGQGPDLGPQYLSAVFYSSDDEKKTVESLMAQLVARGYAVVTKVISAGSFWPAEDYHQDYYARSGKQPYCHARVRRFERDPR